MNLCEEGLGSERRAPVGSGFWSLWQEYRGYVRGVCHRVLGRHDDDVEDALSETMLRAWRYLDTNPVAVDNPRAWLAQIAHHVCIDALRRGSRFVLSSEAGGEDDPDSAPLASDAAEDPEAVVFGRETARQLVGRVRLLPARLRDPVVLHVFHHMPYSDVARHLGITVPNARKRVQIARRLLADINLPAGLGAPASIADTLEIPEPARAPTLVEIPAMRVDTRIVRVPLASGAVMEFRVSADSPPARGDSRVAALRAYIERYPRGWKKRLELANTLFAMGAWAEAIEEYRMVLARQPQLLDVRLQLGYAHHRLGNREEAITTYESALDYAQRPATRHYLKGKVALCRRDHPIAVESFETAASLDPENTTYRNALGSAHQEAGHPIEALAAYGQALRLNADDAVALVGSSEALLSCGRSREAERRLVRACEVQPDCLSALTSLAHRRCTRRLVYGSEGQQTRQIIRRVLKAAPAAASAWDALAHFYVARGEHEKGRMVLKDLVERHPDGPEAWLRYSIRLLQAGQYEAAADAVLRSWAIHPGDPHTARLICSTLPYAGRMQELEATIAAILPEAPGRWDVLVAAGLTLCAWLDQFDRACYLSRRAVELQPELGAAWVRHGEILAGAGQFHEAIDALQRGWALLPPDDAYQHAVSAAFWLARMHAILGEERPARRWHEQMAERARGWIPLDPASAHHALAQALEALGDHAGAAAAYRGALRHHLPYPEREMAQDAAARLLTRRSTSLPAGLLSLSGSPPESHRAS